MKQLTYTITIRAPREVVWNTMLGPQTYPEWTRPFDNDGSTYEGSWDEGCTIRFLSSTGEGMLSVIARNQPHEFISIKHIGMVTADGKDDTESEMVKAWAPAFENYRFEAAGGGTHLTVTLETAEAWAEMMDAMWPQALELLRGLCEDRAGG